MKNVFKAFGIIALIAVIGFYFAACSDGGGGGGGESSDDLPLYIRYVMFRHSSGYELIFLANKVYVKSSSGSAPATYTYKNSSVELGKTLLHFNTSSEQAAFVVLDDVNNWNCKVSTASFSEFGDRIISNDWSSFNPVIDGMEFKLTRFPAYSSEYYYVLDKYSGNTNIITVTIPSKIDINGLPIKYISNVFSNCTTLTAINITADSTFFASQDGILYNKNETSLIICPRGKAGAFSIPNGVTSIESGAFYNCTGLTSFTIPDSVTSIGSVALFGTSWFTNQPDGLVYAGKVAYVYKGTMPSSTSIILNSDTKGIADATFSGCTGLTSVTIPNIRETTRFT